ncbi:membrane metallo-endopeptidase-like 1 [Drosophila kikkawai]|uniref:Membrane metallo-endopeptidase-like 1 n=1 Tax=Drosophila kikkawai TaxID=30033 RepID=A0A6P4J7Q1_DROKI|nr:neprilysin-4 [Drosophila kikkawai]
MTSRGFLWICFLLATAPALAKPTSGADDPFADDLDSEYANQIIRQAKVADIKNMMNPEVAPCDDFYNYACGNWHRHNPAQILSHVVTDTFQVIAKGFDRRLQRLLRSNELKSELEKKMQRFYLACTALNRDDVSFKLALENVYREFGDFPALAGSQWNATDFSWWRTVARIQQKYGKQIILGVDIMPDIRNTSVNRVYLGPVAMQPSSSGFINLLEKSTIARDLHNYLGVSGPVAKHTAEQLQELEKSLQSGSSSGKSLDEQLSLYTLDELQEKYGDHLNFTEFFSLVLGDEHVPEKLYVNDEQFLDNSLLTMRSTPLATQANFVLWNLLQDYLADSKPTELPKWCTEQTKKYFGPLGEHMVYQRYRSPDSEAEITRIWNEVRGIFMEQLRGDKLDWITNATRQLAIEKLSRMQLHINSYDNEDFEEFYGELAIDGLNYVTNLQQVLISKGRRNVRRLDQPARSLEATEILGFTPAYNIQENNITIPVALLQPRYFWGDQYPEALKYATLGYLLAHEMLHGFDDDGRKYDGAGNLAPWWDMKSSYEFEERRKCFQAQYHEYKYGGSKLPESREQSENIADNGGIKLAYKAYQRWLASQTEEVRQRETLEGLSFNGEQLFFVGYAQLWCDDVHSLFKTPLAEADNHAPSMYRVIGSLSNFQEFPWVFNCSQTARMDPEYKCAIY